MMNCWREDPHLRPKFQRIVYSLKNNTVENQDTATTAASSRPPPPAYSDVARYRGFKNSAREDRDSDRHSDVGSYNDRDGDGAIKREKYSLFASTGSAHPSGPTLIYNNASDAFGAVGASTGTRSATYGAGAHTGGGSGEASTRTDAAATAYAGAFQPALEGPTLDSQPPSMSSLVYPPPSSSSTAPDLPTSISRDPARSSHDARGTDDVSRG